jgi:hypothetical protein
MMKWTITTTKNDVSGLWDVEDGNGERLCSICHLFLQSGYGYETRRLARQAIRDYMKTSIYTLVGGLH